PRCCLATARRGGGFENIFKRRLGPDESRSELGGGEVGTKPQKSVASDKTEQELIAFQGVIAISAEQKQSIADGKAASSQTVLSPSTIKGNRSSAEAQAAVGGGLAAAGGNIGGVQRSVSRQAQAALGTGQSQTMPAQAQGAQQGQGQMAGTPEASSNTGSGQTRGNSAAASPRLVDNTVKMNVSANPPQAGSGKPVESANQQSRGGDTESTGLANQPGQVQSKTQPAALSAVTVTGQRNAGQAPGSVAAGGRAGGGEVTSQDRIKDKLGSDRQKGSQQITGDRVSNEPAEKLNVEKIDLFSGKNSMPKPESGNGTPQSAGGQISALEPGQIAAGSRSLVADQSHVTANNGSTSDTAAAIREQICQSIQVSIQQGNSQITIHLNPPDLGRVSVKFSQQGNELTGLLEATNPQTRAEIRQAIPEIIRSLEESGISVKHIDVTLSDSPRQPAQESFRDNSSQDLWQQLGNQGFQNTGGNRPSPDSFVTPAYSEDGTAVHNDTSLGRNQSSPSDNLLDVLI
ncbi:MAG: flagellar hook-length control protein FliK, partial [Sedimentisphaerales bacterium]|nr:flagellar hook-length control protein FliK [Sedimentisphaerales bacterium]